MARELYNEGRVVGYSAYEEYVKQFLSEDPDAEPVSERAWLAATLALGTSMLLRIDPADEDREQLVRDFKLPENSTLVAPSTILGSMFITDPNDFSDDIYDETGWVKQVASYGDLILNDLHHPEDEALTYDFGPDSMDDDEKARMMNYLRIQDGLVLQPGTWETRTTEDADWLLDDNNDVVLTEDDNVGIEVNYVTNKPYRILKKPNFTESPTIRLRFSRPVTRSFFVLFTGFTDFGVVMGETGIDGGAADTYRPENGDFLGPEIFPWANKIMFSTSSAIAYQMQTSLSAGSKNVIIETDPDSFETTISVENDISSNSPYLSVVQTNDGGKTVLDLDVAGLLNDYLKAGTGILLDINSSTGVITVKTNLEGGTGISITNDTSSTKQTIATNIVAGAGISTTTDKNGALVITNTQTNSSYISLTNKKNYLVWNDWDTETQGSRPTNRDYWIRWYNNFYAHEIGYDNSAMPSTRSTMQVYYAPSYSTDSDGNQVLTAANFRISAANAYAVYRYGNMQSSSGFQFRHSNSWKLTTIDPDGVPESRICEVVFPSRSDYRNLSDPSASFVDNTSGLGGVWNMRARNSSSGSYHNFGGTWPVRVTVSQDTDTWEGYSAYILSAVNIGDGYNSQYSNSPYTDYYDITSRNLNISVDFTITL